MKLRRWLAGGALALVMALGVLVGSASSRAEEVSILMPSSFTDASADLVKAFNREHRGRIHLKLDSRSVEHGIDFRPGDQQSSAR